jgi:hypothetical protein
VNLWEYASGPSSTGGGAQAAARAAMIPAMTMGMGIVLLAVGAILRYAVEDQLSGIDIPTVGLILMIAGAIAFVVGAIYAFGRRDQYQGPPAPPRGP